ncbi:hypothetical protein H8959_012707 [Pygathrix nigripes]
MYAKPESKVSADSSSEDIIEALISLFYGKNVCMLPGINKNMKNRKNLNS